MKIRLGFVSNSSSSSFLAICVNKNDIPIDIDDILDENICEIDDTSDYIGYTISKVSDEDIYEWREEFSIDEIENSINSLIDNTKTSRDKIMIIVGTRSS